MSRNGNGSPPQSAVLLICLLLMTILAARGFAETDPEDPLALIVRPGRLPASPGEAGNFLFPTRNPFVWPADLKARLELLDGAPRPDPYEDLVLNGIIWSSPNPVVIINNTELRTGETIDGIKIKEITRDSVVLATQKTRRTLRFPSSGIDFSITPAEVE